MLRSNKKRHFILVAALLAVVLLASACGSVPATTALSTTPASTTTTTTTASPAVQQTVPSTSAVTTSTASTPESVDVSSMTLLSVLSGSISLRKAGKTEWIPVERGTELSQGDSIKSGSESTARIIFFDGSVLEIEPDTEVRLSELSLYENGTTTIRLKQQIGKTVSRVQKLADTKSRYDIGTPTVIAAVRGSTMIVEVLPDTTTTVTNVSGDIRVIAQGIETIIPEGMQSTTSAGQSPGQPEPTPVPTTTYVPEPESTGYPHYHYD